MQSIRPTIQLKEVQALHFFLDIDRNQRISRDEFLKQLERAQAMYSDRKVKIAGGDFDCEESA